MHANLSCRWLLVSLLVVSPYFLATYARGGGRGGGGRGGGSRGSSGSRGFSYSRPPPSYSRPSPSSSRRSPSYSRPAPAPAPSYSRPSPSYSRPAPAPAPSYSRPSPSYSRPSPSYSRPAPVPARKPFPATAPKPAPPVRQPAYNPNFKEPSSGFGAGSRQPAYNPNYKPDNNKPVGPPPPYSPAGYPVPNAPVGPPPSYQSSKQLGQPPPYPGQPGVNRPYPQQSPGGNVWQPHYGMPAPSYMNYGGIPAGTNMHVKPHKKKGFIGSLMSLSKKKSEKKNKYYGSYPSSYGIGGSGMGHGVNSSLGKHGSSRATYAIFLYMAAKKGHKIHKPKFSFMSIYYGSHYRYHYHHYHQFGHDGDINPEYTSYFDVYNDNYVGKCQKPLKKRNSSVNCSATFDELQCTVKCKEGYRYPNDTKFIKNKCWHVTGVWKPTKNFPDCIPFCDEPCLNGGKCIGSGICMCTSEFRGKQCEFDYLKCDIRLLLSEERRVNWVCHHFTYFTACKVECKKPAQFEYPSAAEYRCTPDGIWTPNVLPRCVVKEGR